MKYKLLLLITLLVTIFGCDDDKPQAVLVLPTDLKVEIILSEENEGIVNVIATAKNANFYTLIFQDGENSAETVANNGRASHTYSASGLYTVIARAHATTLEYTQREDTIKINKTPTTNEDGVPTKGYTTPMTRAGYTLVWNDEFDGNELDPNNWNFEIGTGNSGWGNNELQYYLKENTKLKNGYLTIEAKRQAVESSLYTSSRITTQGKKSFKYGRIDIRAAMPKGQGLWPALWMLGDNIGTAGWPYCGEIDIMEMVGGTAAGKSDRVTHGTLHWDNNGSYASFGGKTTTTKTNLNEEFHVYSIEWNQNSIKWFLDDRHFHTIEISPAAMSEFHQTFFFIMNVAVGGRWPGSPDETTHFSQKMHVDYVRVFQ